MSLSRPVTDSFMSLSYYYVVLEYGCRHKEARPQLRYMYPSSLQMCRPTRCVVT